MAFMDLDMETLKNAIAGSGREDRPPSVGGILRRATGTGGSTLKRSMATKRKKDKLRHTTQPVVSATMAEAAAGTAAPDQPDGVRTASSKRTMRSISTPSMSVPSPGSLTLHVAASEEVVGDIQEEEGILGEADKVT